MDTQNSDELLQAQENKALNEEESAKKDEPDIKEEPAISFSHIERLLSLSKEITHSIKQVSLMETFDKQATYQGFVRIVHNVLTLAIMELPALKGCSYSSSQLIEIMTVSGIPSTPFLLGRNNIETYILAINRVSAYVTLAIEIPGEDSDEATTYTRDLINIMSALGLISSIAEDLFEANINDLLRDMGDVL